METSSIWKKFGGCLVHLECTLKMFRYSSHKMMPLIPLVVPLIPTTEEKKHAPYSALALFWHCNFKILKFDISSLKLNCYWYQIIRLVPEIKSLFVSSHKTILETFSSKLIVQCSFLNMSHTDSEVIGLSIENFRRNIYNIIHFYTTANTLVQQISVTWLCNARTVPSLSAQMGKLKYLTTDCSF